MLKPTKGKKIKVGSTRVQRVDHFEAAKKRRWGGGGGGGG